MAAEKSVSYLVRVLEIIGEGEIIVKNMVVVKGFRAGQILTHTVLRQFEKEEASTLYLTRMRLRKIGEDKFEILTFEI